MLERKWGGEMDMWEVRKQVTEVGWGEAIEKAESVAGK